MCLRSSSCAVTSAPESMRMACSARWRSRWVVSMRARDWSRWRSSARNGPFRCGRALLPVGDLDRAAWPSLVVKLSVCCQGSHASRRSSLRVPRSGCGLRRSRVLPGGRQQCDQLPEQLLVERTVLLQHVRGLVQRGELLHPLAEVVLQQPRALRLAPVSARSRTLGDQRGGVASLVAAGSTEPSTRWSRLSAA